MSELIIGFGILFFLFLCLAIGLNQKLGKEVKRLENILEYKANKDDVSVRLEYSTHKISEVVRMMYDCLGFNLKYARGKDERRWLEKKVEKKGKK